MPRAEGRSRSSDPHTRIPLLAGHWLVLGVLLTLVIDAILLHQAHLSIAISLTSLGYAAAAGIAIFARYRLRAPASRGQRIARDLIEGVLVFVAISLLGAIATYPLATESRGFVNHGLQRFDAALNFNWLAWYALVASHSWIQAPERAAYLSIYVTPAILLLYFAASGRSSEARLFLASYWIAAVVTLSLFPLVPAAGPLLTLGHGATPYMPLSALYQDQVILALRSRSITTVDLGALHGLVCAPSFHAVSAVIYTATAWRSARLRWPIAAINVAMLLATPIEGTHYLIDIVMGVLVAAIALILTPVLIKLAENRRPLSLRPLELRRSR